MIKELINTILKKYYNEKHQCYNRHREDECNYYDVLEEIEQELNARNIQFKVHITDAFECSDYECSVLSIAYIESNNNLGSLKLETVLLEDM